MAALRLLAVAAASGRIAYVYLIGNRLMDWRVSDKASDNEAEAAKSAARWIETLQPDVVVTEDTLGAKKKGRRTKEIIASIAEVASRAEVLDVSVVREQLYPNKYVEAKALAERYPDLQPWLPYRRLLLDNEHRNTVIFEALALAQVILQGPTPALAYSKQ
jgi:hypothetical protein